MKFLLALIILMLSGPAAADPAAAKAWVCQRAPGWQMCRAEPGGPHPVVEPEPDLSPVYPPDMLPQPQASPPVSVPLPVPKPAPVTTAKPKPAPTKARRQRDEDEDERPKAKKSAPQADGGSCFFPVSCAYVCQQARAGDSRRGTDCQNAKGEACIRRLCPEVFK